MGAHINVPLWGSNFLGISPIPSKERSWESLIAK